MSIFYDEKQKLFQLDTKTTSYVIGIADGYAGHAYYGKKLESLEGLGALLRTGEAPFVPSENMRYLKQEVPYLLFFEVHYLVSLQALL